MVAGKVVTVSSQGKFLLGKRNSRNEHWLEDAPEEMNEQICSTMVKRQKVKASGFDSSDHESLACSEVLDIVVVGVKKQEKEEEEVEIGNESPRQWRQRLSDDDVHENKVSLI